MTLLRIFAPGVVLLTWALVWALGLRGDAVIGAGLALLTVAAFVSEHELYQLRRRHGPSS